MAMQPVVPPTAESEKQSMSTLNLGLYHQQLTRFETLPPSLKFPTLQVQSLKIPPTTACNPVAPHAPSCMPMCTCHHSRGVTSSCSAAILVVMATTTLPRSGDVNPGGRLKRRRDSSPPTRVRTSAWPYACPTQFLMPSPNGMYRLYCCCSPPLPDGAPLSVPDLAVPAPGLAYCAAAPSGPSQRSGLKVLGLSHSEVLLCSRYCGAQMTMPGGRV
mmetsp:Transcript_20895/g.53154  ORF Transcript_20895/g.53154 Transcript_20895/m.53154 type:complete len:216 (-) Transcript_20895:191-838(-)